MALAAVDGNYDIIFDATRGFLGDKNQALVSKPRVIKNLEKLIGSIINYAKFKKEQYKKYSPENELRQLTESNNATYGLMQKYLAGGGDQFLQSEEAKSAVQQSLTQKVIEKFSSLIKNIAQFQTKINSNEAVIQRYCSYKENDLTILEPLYKKIFSAIENLRSEVSGDAKEAVENRKKIESYLVNFAYSWGSFKGSYILNFCLTGGAGVGKTTFAKAIAKCFSAFGILATETVKEASKTDFIGNYVGESTYKTQDTLYSSLEGICFIDEAYAVGSTKYYGPEAISELTFFTQKFPGCSSIIVAGYEKEMKRDFFAINEGLYRRFPNTIELKPYDIQTILNTLLKRVTTKMFTTTEQQRTAKYSLEYFFDFLYFLYMDMKIEDFDSYYINVSKMTRTHTITSFNMKDICRFLYRSQSIYKKNILKTYILKYIVGIEEGDLFPNQMGDIQNIVDIITSTTSIVKGETVSLTDAVNVFNQYLAIRKRAYVSVNVVPVLPLVPQGEVQAYAPRLNLVTDGYSVSQMDNTLNALVNNIYGLIPPSTATAAQYSEIDVRINKLYTKAVVYLFNYISTPETEDKKEVAKLSTHVDINFLKQEKSKYDELVKNRVGNAEVSLVYRDTIVDIQANLSGYNANAYPKTASQTIKEICALKDKTTKNSQHLALRPGGDAGVAPTGLIGAGAGGADAAPPPPPPPAATAAPVTRRTYTGQPGPGPVTRQPEAEPAFLGTALYAPEDQGRPLKFGTARTPPQPFKFGQARATERKPGTPGGWGGVPALMPGTKVLRDMELNARQLEQAGNPEAAEDVRREIRRLSGQGGGKQTRKRKMNQRKGKGRTLNKH